MKITRKVKVEKKYWEKGKSKFLCFRPDLQKSEPISFDITFRKEEDIRISNNILRRKNLAINKDKYPESYYHDTDVYTNKENHCYKYKV